MRFLFHPMAVPWLLRGAASTAVTDAWGLCLKFGESPDSQHMTRRHVASVGPWVWSARSSLVRGKPCTIIDGRRCSWISWAAPRSERGIDGSAKRIAASWELRCGRDNRFRVFSDVDLELNEVHVLAIALKDRNRLLIGAEECEL
jgi:hypothetical protein